ncbi:Hypothetical protein I5071_9430 [Sandaracinus amylolyticus]|nr:Hypothetical protein I5071_9430 [Sandaracinus amylolyticus]
MPVCHLVHERHQEAAQGGHHEGDPDVSVRHCSCEDTSQREGAYEPNRDPYSAHDHAPFTSWKTVLMTASFSSCEACE